MIANPCDATLVPGLYGDSEGMLARFRSVQDVSTATATDGYILWAPEFHCPGGQTSTGVRNLFAFHATTANDRPTNVGTTSAFGDASLTIVGAAGSSIEDPAYNWVGGETAQDARTLSSCMKMTYNGPMTEASGQVAFLEGVSASTLLFGGTNGATATIGQLFNMAATTQRLGTDTLEIVWRPDPEAGESFTYASSTGLATDLYGSQQGVFTLGNNATTLTTQGMSQTQRDPKLYGFAWKNLTAGTENLTFDLVKNIEWKPSAAIGMPQTTPRQLNVTSQLPRTLHALDQADPAWTKRVVNGSKGIVSQIANAAFTGTSSGLTQALLTQGATAYMQRFRGGGQARLGGR